MRQRGADVHYLDRQGRDALLHACNHRRNDEGESLLNVVQVAVLPLSSVTFVATLASFSFFFHVHVTSCHDVVATSPQPLSCDCPVVMALIAAGADVSRSDRLGNTNLYFAACEGSPSIVRMLFEAGGDGMRRHWVCQACVRVGACVC